MIVTVDTQTGMATTVAVYDAGVPPGGGPPLTGVSGAVGAPDPGLGALLVFARYYRR